MVCESVKLDLIFNQQENLMFGSKSEKEKLEAKYHKLSQESFKLSTIDRKKSDIKAAEADEVRKQLDALDDESK